MADLLELAQQGDPATVAESKLSSMKLMPPRELYLLWERQQWQSQAIDFSRDLSDWDALGADKQGFLIWNLASFFVGEERVTTAFSPIVMSAADATVAAKVLVPPGMEGQDEYMTPAGYHSSEINTFAFTALSRRLKVIGIGLPVPA